jgi:hypothetical protein
MAILGKQAVSTIHPKYWPYCDGDEGGIRLYESTTSRECNAAPFWSTTNSFADSTFGHRQTTGSKTADTYYTYVDITGSHGAMGTIIFPQNATTASGFYTIKLTTDGVVEEFKTLTTSMSNNRRKWLGFAKEYGQTNDVRYQSVSGYGLHRFYDENAGVDAYPGGGVVRSAQDMVVQGLPAHLFDTSLKVEVKCSIAGHANAEKGYGGVLAYSFPN